MKRQIRMGSSDIRQIDFKRVMAVLDSGQLSPGPACREFERKFARFVRCRHALFVNSGTDALRIALLAMKEKFGWKDGSVIFVPSLTFPATLNVVLQAGLKPYVVDVSVCDFTLNIEMLEHILSNTEGDYVAVIPVHLFGQLADMKRLMPLAKKFKLKVLEDSCERIEGSVGIYGDAACFSTYQCHHLQTGVGGLAVTQDDALNELMRSLANHGRDTAYLPGYRTPKKTPDLLSRRFRFVRPGYSCRATEFQAALGLGQLERFQDNLSLRREIAYELIKQLSDLFELVLPRPTLSHTFMMFPVVLRQGSRFKKRDVVWALEKTGIETRDMMPITNQPAFSAYLGPGTFSVAAWVNQNGFYLPCHSQMSLEDVGFISRTLRKCLTRRS